MDISRMSRMDMSESQLLLLGYVLGHPTRLMTNLDPLGDIYRTKEFLRFES